MKRNTLTISLVTVVALVAAIAVAAVALRDSGGATRTSAANSHFPAADQARRTVYVYQGREPAASPPGSKLRALRVKGPMPTSAVIATVLSDENCEPDAQGVSHCINRLRLPNGKTLVVRHPHNMADVPCLAPREKVVVRPA